MTPASRVTLRQAVMVAEGCRLKPYRDTVGVLSIGYGRNLDDVGISQLEAEVLLDHDLATAEIELRKALPWVSDLSEGRQQCLVEMAFNLGVPRLLGFKNTLAAVKAKDYEGAARGMLASKWAAQVKGRAVRLADQMRG